MAKERAAIRGSEVVSVKVGKVWTVVMIKIPTANLVRQGAKMDPMRRKGAAQPAKKAWVKRRAKKVAAIEEKLRQAPIAAREPLWGSNATQL